MPYLEPFHHLLQTHTAYPKHIGCLAYVPIRLPQRHHDQSPFEPLNLLLEVELRGQGGEFEPLLDHRERRIDLIPFPQLCNPSHSSTVIPIILSTSLINILKLWNGILNIGGNCHSVLPPEHELVACPRIRPLKAELPQPPYEIPPHSNPIRL